MGIHSSPHSNYEASREFWRIVDASYGKEQILELQAESRHEFRQLKARQECPNCLRDDGKHDRTCPLRPYDWAEFDDPAWD
jgi:hypothetical protein